jgi:hypothetical protein
MHNPRREISTNDHHIAGITTITPITQLLMGVKQPDVRRKLTPSALILLYYTISRLASDSSRDLSGEDLAVI